MILPREQQRARDYCTIPNNPDISKIGTNNTGGVDSRRICILVLGMHRSGTSALARAISLLGIDLPKNVYGAAKGNEAGHWEPINLIPLNNRIMAEIGGRWDDWGDLNLSQLTATKEQKFRNEISEIIKAEYENTSIFVLKEPRISRMVPLYRDVLNEMGIDVHYVISTRNPISIAKSLAIRDGIGAGRSALLWLSYQLDIERETRGLNRVFVSYEQLLEDPAAGIDALTQNLNIDWSSLPNMSRKELGKNYSVRYNHNPAAVADLKRHMDFPGWVTQLHLADARLIANPADKRAIRVYDSVYDDFKKSAQIFSEAFKMGYGDNVIGGSLDEQFNIEKLTEELHYIAEKLKRERLEKIKQVTKHNRKLSKASEKLEGVVEAHARELKQLEEIRTKEAVNASKCEKSLRAEIEILRVEGSKRSADKEVYLREIRTFSDHVNQLQVENNDLNESLSASQSLNENLNSYITQIFQDLQREKLSVWRPLYRNVYRHSGLVLRNTLPERLVGRIKSSVPNPDRVPNYTPPLSEEPVFDTGDLASISPPIGRSDVFVLSIIDWDFRTQRPQHLSRALSTHRRVFYLEMMLSSEHPKLRRIDDNIWIVRLPGQGIGHIQPYTGEPDIEKQHLWVRQFLKFCDSIGATAFKSIIVQHPFWWQLARHLPPEFEVVFDCMDDISGFSNTTSQVIDLELDLLKNCDKLVVSSQCLFDKYSNLKKPTLVRNGCELGHFRSGDQPVASPDFLVERGFTKREGVIDVGYVGAIAEWFDAALIRDIALEHPEFNFHLCGSVTTPGPAVLEPLENVTFYGEIPYGTVPAFIDQMDVMTIPFHLHPIIQACDPVKFYEYSAMGKPTVATQLPELKRAENLVFFASDSKSFAKQISTAANRRFDTDVQASLYGYAEANTWRHRGEQMLAVIEANPPVSVVILAYGDASWTDATLHSLFEGGANYPSLEVIVVDNGSAKDVLAKLHKTADNYPNVRIIENGENLGFARGNNVGIQAANGEYVMLLNNDTYLAPGAIFSMVRHLRDNPDVGVVGPLTNNIGNEAKLDVSYSNMSEMKIRAREVTTGYRGMFTPISVTAYFAVMFRRSDLKKFGLLCEDYGRGMFEDDDHCATIKQHGYICSLAEDAFVHHHLSATFSTIDKNDRKALFDQNKAIYESKWGPWIPHKYRDRRPTGSLGS